MKQLRKADMLKKGQEGHIRAERDLLAAAATTTRWTVPLASSFQDMDHLYLVMNYMAGGGMFRPFFSFPLPLNLPSTKADLLTFDFFSPQTFSPSSSRKTPSRSRWLGSTSLRWCSQSRRRTRCSGRFIATFVSLSPPPVSPSFLLLHTLH